MKPWLAINQLGKDISLKLVDVLNGEQKSASYLAVNPKGVVPFLVTADGEGIGESNAILWYLAEGTHLMPQTAQARAEALQWMFFEQTKLEPFIAPARFFSFIVPQERDAHHDEIIAWQEGARPGLAQLDDHLAKRRFILEQGYSVADIAVFGYVHVLQEAGLDIVETPNIARWIEDVSKTENFCSLDELSSHTLRAA
ncbi:Disulfide-bond oxidoreductase YfcG [Octadecabacter ascidiaceicola]|uniref:Disulfide-bond oxidoreductase YfcG n=2 Tax=Octadecabacter ascidiaceicola TaxID=1655543 RepID=A0A238JS26_9RHOB|nr:Disulfide-bond oxidoreductase YfcG [Octadecabacter ascidiaceicola]